MLFRLMHYVCSSVAVKRMKKQKHSSADFTGRWIGQHWFTKSCFGIISHSPYVGNLGVMSDWAFG